MPNPLKFVGRWLWNWLWSNSYEDPYCRMIPDMPKCLEATHAD